MGVSFDRPLWLFAVVLAAAVVVAGQGAVPRVPPRQHRLATLTRAGAVVLLVLALAGPRWRLGAGSVDVVFLLDASDSVGAGGHEQALRWVEGAVAAKPGSDRAALAVFGADARVEHGLRDDPPTGPVATVIDPSATDIAQALRLAQGVLGSDHRRRAVVLTDGRENRGDAVAAAHDLAAAGIGVDVVALPQHLAADVLVEEVRAPHRVRAGEAFDVAAVVHNTAGDPADVVVTVTADGEAVHRETVTAAPGRTEVRVRRTAPRAGTLRYEVRLASGASTVADNDVGRAAVRVDGPPKVLVVEGTPGVARDLAAALEAGRVGVDRRPADAGLDPLDRLLAYDAVVLVDVPAAALGDDAMKTLDAFVRDAGHGVVAVGGERSFGMGGYDGTPLEGLLPVFSQVRDPKRRPSVAEALVVDVSGSMAACHCQDGGFGGAGGMGGGPVEGGVNKTDISKEAVARAIDVLSADDTVGVLAFNTESEWVIPLQKLPDHAVVDSGLARLHPEGGTSIPQAVREAIAALRDVDARLRHIVLFTDGFTEDHALVEVAREAAEAGVTLSVVGTGEGPGEVLKEMAAAGGGRYYPGRDLASIPDIIVSEVLFAARPIVNEGRFLPVVATPAPVTENLEATPPLLGYLATTAKPTARTVLRIGEHRDPLFASWQAGLGTAVAWTSDAAPRWSAHWVGWEGFTRFWSEAVKSTFPADPDPGFDLSAAATPDRLHVTLRAGSTLPADAEATATVTAPDGARTDIRLLRTGLDSFEADVPGGAEGIYAVTARLATGDRTVLFQDTTTAIRSYSPEYAATTPDPALPARLARAGGGRLDPAPQDAFDPAGLLPGGANRDLAGVLLAAALLLLPVDVGLRRLRLEREDWRRLRAWARGRRSRDGDTPTSETTGALLAAKRRARGGDRGAR